MTGKKKITEEVAVNYVKPIEESILIRSTPEFLPDNKNVTGVLAEKGMPVVPIIRRENGYGKLPDGYIKGLKGEAWIQLAFTKKYPQPERSKRAGTDGTACKRDNRSGHSSKISGDC